VSPSLRAAALALAVLGADQGAKALARGAVARGDSDPIFPGLELVNTRNTGVAFGLLDGGGALIALVAVVALAALVAFFYFNRGKRLVWLPTGLLVGGAAGNLVDRAGGEGVTDFLKIPLWPAFNLADVAITAGVLSLLYVLERPRDA
jgi:signal peptidase II